MVTIVMIEIIMMIVTPVLYGSQYEDNIKKSFPLDANGTLLLDTVRGNINLSTHSKNQVDVYVSTASDIKGEIQKAEILFRSTGSVVKVTADEQLLKANVSVEYFVEVPENLNEIQLITRLGEITSHGNYGKLRLHTNTGKIDFKGNATQGFMQSANGNISASIRGELKGNLTIKNVNGDIRVKIRSASDFTINGKSTTGTIRSDFKSVTKSDPKGSHITGKINNATHLLKLETINGDIKILR